MPRHSITISPRFYETDALGHINNASIAAWLEVVRMSFLQSLGDQGDSSAFSWILASVHIDFIAETFYGREVTGTVTDASIGNSSLTVVSELAQGGELTVRAKAVLVHLDLATKLPSRISDELRERLAAS